MAAKKRYFEPGYIYHVLNRGTNRQCLFMDYTDYYLFEELIAQTLERTRLEIFTYQLMPNHWHFLVRPESKEDLSDFFQYLSGTHSKRYRAVTGTTGEGHVYQDRFKSFPVQSDSHFLTVARYIERNAKRAKLVARAEDWRWGGLWRRLSQSEDWLISEWPVLRPLDWTERVNKPLTESELHAVRKCIQRGKPYGTQNWIHETAKRMGLTHTLRRIGRPRKYATITT